MSEPSQPAKILIADDHPHGVELLEAYLSDTPYETRPASNGEDTLNLVQSWKPDVVLLDVMMPRMSGFEVCKRIRADEATRDIAVLMITALDEPSDVERAVEVGTDDFLTKPVNKTELLLRIRALLKSREMSSEPRRTISYIEEVQQSS